MTDSNQTGYCFTARFIREVLLKYLREGGLLYQSECGHVDPPGQATFTTEFGGTTMLKVFLEPEGFGFVAEISVSEVNEKTKQMVRETRKVLSPIFLEFALFDQSEFAEVDLSVSPKQIEVFNLLVKRFRKRGLSYERDKEEAGSVVVSYDQEKYTIKPDGNYIKS